MPAPLRIQLTDIEDEELAKLIYSDGVPRRVKQRATALRLNHRGWKVSQIAEYLDWAAQTVRETIHRFSDNGTDGLGEAAGRGRKRSWSEADWQQLEQWLEAPQRYSATQLQRQWQDKCGVSVGAEQVRRIVKKKVMSGNGCVSVRHCHSIHK